MTEGLSRIGGHPWLRAGIRLFQVVALLAAVILAVPSASWSQSKNSAAKSGSSTQKKSSGKSSAKSSGNSKSKSSAKSTGKTSGKSTGKKSGKSSGKSSDKSGAKKSGGDQCGKATWHKVVPGDTLWELAGRYRTSVEALQRMNGSKAKKLKPGVRLMVKAAKPCPKPAKKKDAKPAVEHVADETPRGADDGVVEPAPLPAAAKAVEAGPETAPSVTETAETVAEPRAAALENRGSAAGPGVEPAEPVVVTAENAAESGGEDEIDDEADEGDGFVSGGIPAVNVPAEVGGTGVPGVHPDEDLALYDEASEVGGDDLPVVIVTPEAGVPGIDPAETEIEDDGIAADDIEPDEKDPYSGDGIPDDLPELPDFAEFGFTDDGAACADYLLALSPMPKTPKGTVNFYHKVRKGDSLSRIAKKYKTSVRNLERLNGLRGNPKKTKRLMHPGKLVMVRLGDPKDLLAARPFLADWVELKTQKGYNIKRPAAGYGRPFAMRLMLRAMCEFRRRNPDSGNIVVGDWSGRVGGQLGRHLSHRTGRDVDLSYFVAGKPNLKHFSKVTPATMDVALSWELVRALLDTHQIEFIFMDWTLQRAIYDYAVSKGFPENLLNQIFQYPEGRRVRSGIIRWARGHDNHIHVRFKCPKDDPKCR